MSPGGYVSCCLLERVLEFFALLLLGSKCSLRALMDKPVISLQLPGQDLQLGVDRLDA